MNKHWNAEQLQMWWLIKRYGQVKHSIKTPVLGGEVIESTNAPTHAPVGCKGGTA